MYYNIDEMDISISDACKSALMTMYNDLVIQ